MKNQKNLGFILFILVFILSVYVIDYFGTNREIIQQNNKEIVKNDSINILIVKNKHIIMSNEQTIINNQEKILSNQ